MTFGFISIRQISRLGHFDISVELLIFKKYFTGKRIYDTYVPEGNVLFVDLCIYYLCSINPDRVFPSLL